MAFNTTRRSPKSGTRSHLPNFQLSPSLQIKLPQAFETEESFTARSSAVTCTWLRCGVTDRGIRAISTTCRETSSPRFLTSLARAISSYLTFQGNTSAERVIEEPSRWAFEFPITQIRRLRRVCWQ